jgi:protein TIF31
VELSGLSAAISHFLNCFLSSYPNPVAHLPADELLSKKRNKRRKNRPPGAADNTAWAVMTPQELWKNICHEAKNYFDFTLEWYGHRAQGSPQCRRLGVGLKQHLGPVV